MSDNDHSMSHHHSVILQVNTALTTFPVILGILRVRATDHERGKKTIKLHC